MRTRNAYRMGAQELLTECGTARAPCAGRPRSRRCSLLLARRRLEAAHVLVASTGAAGLMFALKDAFARPRPEVIPRLVQVAGFSYPSGHSLASASVYATLALIAMRRFPTWGARVAVAAMALGLVLAIGESRVYLGVHYPTDVAGGIAVGLAWGLLVAAGFRELSSRARRLRG